mmetsp:Transcript_25762/g.54200  ORF Transcript_25762/g.54200 Transcript_25762/m.54200 type:complete len:242 (-) Transcript_25762:506-1231(-)
MGQKLSTAQKVPNQKIHLSGLPPPNQSTAIPTPIRNPKCQRQTSHPNHLGTNIRHSLRLPRTEEFPLPRTLAHERQRCRTTHQHHHSAGSRNLDRSGRTLHEILFPKGLSPIRLFRRPAHLPGRMGSIRQSRRDEIPTLSVQPGLGRLDGRRERRRGLGGGCGPRIFSGYRTGHQCRVDGRGVFGSGSFRCGERRDREGVWDGILLFASDVANLLAEISNATFSGSRGSHPFGTIRGAVSI